VFGPRLLVASLVPRTGGFKHGNTWQYHSRSDHHSKVACWGLMLDLMQHCALLRDHTEKGLVGYGLNHEMRDFKTGRKKDLDLVICRPRSEPPKRGPVETFAGEAEELGVVLVDDAGKALAALPTLLRLPVGAVHVAVEAKAAMTEFGKARPRLYDELSSSHQVIHGNSAHTIAAALVMVNVADTFISPGRNDWDLSARPPFVSRHNQPRDAGLVIEKLHEIPRRNKDGEEGFDALGIVVVEVRNDGTPVRLVEAEPAPQAGDVYNYEMTVHRLAQLYEQRFGSIG
jgi:hypothetical protein